ncbi:MAG: biliverdin-producing heme oxygenase [Proteobacteria bacterium]|nr:MAG: biliverdin-producing heme oxygenase [Pseudomonadota bacterium]
MIFQDMIRERLKTETRAVHERLETTLDLMSESLTHERYEKTLLAMAAFYRGLEKQLSLLPGRVYEGRSKAAWFEQDYQALKLDPSKEKPCPVVPHLNSEAEKLGAMYVVEGATLGGRFVSKHLSERLGLSGDSGASFFSAYREKTGERWKEFVAHLESTPGSADLVVSGAHQTFSALEKWLSQELG